MSPATIRERYNEASRTRRCWRCRPNGYEEMRKAWERYCEEGEKARLALPFPTAVAYAYSPRENTGSQGRDHIIVTEETQVGRRVLKPGDALCKPASQFWGLCQMSTEGRKASCVRCLELAAKWAAKGEGR